MGNGAAHYEAEQMIGGFPAVLRCKNIQEIYPLIVADKRIEWNMEATGHLSQFRFLSSKGATIINNAFLILHKYLILHPLSRRSNTNRPGGAHGPFREYLASNRPGNWN